MIADGSSEFSEPRALEGGVASCERSFAGVRDGVAPGVAARAEVVGVLRGFGASTLSVLAPVACSPGAVRDGDDAVDDAGVRGTTAVLGAPAFVFAARPLPVDGAPVIRLAVPVVAGGAGVDGFVVEPNMVVDGAFATGGFAVDAFVVGVPAAGAFAADAPVGVGAGAAVAVDSAPAGAFAADEFGIVSLAVEVPGVLTAAGPVVAVAPTGADVSGRSRSRAMLVARW